MLGAAGGIFILSWRNICYKDKTLAASARAAERATDSMNPFKPLSRWLPFLALLLMTAAYYAIPWQSAPWLAAVVGVPFLLLYCVLFPGYSLVRRFGDPSSGAIERVAWAAFSGFAVLLACAFVWALSGVSLATFAGVLPIVTVAVTLTARGGLARRGDPPANPPPAGTASSRWGLAVAALAVLMGLLVLLTGPPTGYSSDTIDYIAYTNEVARTGDPFPTSEFYLDAGANGADLRKGLLHSLYGYFKWYLGIDTLVLFRWLGAAFLALVMLAVYTAARAFFPGRAVAALSVVFFVLGFDGGLDSPLIRSFFYPGRFAVGYLLLFLVVALDFVTRPRPKSLVWCSIFAFAAAAVHIQYAVLIGFVAGTILLWKTCFNTGSWREHLVRSSSLGLAAFMGMLPYAAFRYLTAFQSGGASDLHRQIQGAMFVSDRLFIANPLTAWQGAGLFGLAAAMAVIPLWPRRREYPALGYLIASMLTVVLIQFNPLFMPLFYSAITYLVYRLGIICPYYVLAAYFVVTAVRGAATGSPPLRRVVLAVTAIAVVAGLSPALTRNAFSPATIAAERETGYPRWKDGLSKLGELPGRAVIASDPVTSYMISAFTPHFVVCTFDQHAPPSDLLSRERSIAARDILSPFTSSSDKGHQIAKHQVTHVVVNENLDVTDRSDFWTVGKESAPLVRGRLGALNDMFIEEGAVGGLRLYRAAGNAPRHVAAVQNPLLRRRVPPDAVKVGETAGLARLEAARIAAPDTVRGGDEIEVTLYWLRQEELPLDKYVVTIRFDRTDVELPFGGKPFPKIARKLKERVNGERYRFRHDHQIMDGFVSPDTWPPGVFVVDRTVVRIPAYAAAGRYEVRARLITGSTAPNYRIRDFLYDDDIYQGVVIGEITTGR
jgi:hypothetical protein